MRVLNVPTDAGVPKRSYDFFFMKIMRINGDHLEVEYCPHCRVNSPNLAKVWETGNMLPSGQVYQSWYVFKCGKCKNLVMVSKDLTPSKPEESILAVFPNVRDIDSSITDVRIKHHLSEALTTLHAPSACIVSAASAVDAMLKAKNFKTGKLYPRINQAKDAHLITEEMAAWAHDIRLDANDERHSDEEAPIPTQQDAQKCLDFAFALAEYLFVLPSKVERGRAITT
jgi:hypothetical protein